MSTNSSNSAVIRVAPLVRKFLSCHYPIVPEFRLYSQNNPYANYLLNALESYPSKEAFREYEQLKDTITVTFSRHQVENQFYNRNLTQQKLVGFNNFVHQQFMIMATREMVVRVETGEKIERAARMILDRYKLTEDDLSLDTLTRYYRAYKDTIFGRIKAAW